MEFTRLIRTTLLSMFMLYGEKSILVRVGDGCRVAGLAENITNTLKVKLKLRLSLAI